MNFFGLFIFSLGCSSSSIIEGTVTDIWGNPLANASVTKYSSVFSSEKTTDEDGSFQFLSYNGEHNFTVSLDGHITEGISFDYQGEKNTPPDHLQIELYPMPSERGIFAIGSESYIQLDMQTPKAVGTHLEEIQGIKSIGNVKLHLHEDPAFIFYIGEELEWEDIKQIKLKLHKLKFVEKKGYTVLEGNSEDEILLYTASGTRQNFQFEQLDDEVYKITTKGLDKGKYAFHIYDSMITEDLQKIPKDVRRAYPFRLR